MFTRSSLSLALAILGTVLVRPVLAQTEMPPDQSIQMSIHADPDDSESPVRFKLTLNLSAESLDGSTIAWHVNWIEIDHLDPYGELIDSWYELDPEVNTPDGAWVATHADPLAPAIEEFSVPPEIQGFATSKSNVGDELQYHLAGQVGKPEAVEPYAVTVFADYLFWKVSDTEPLDEGGEIPVEGNEGDGTLG